VAADEMRQARSEVAAWLRRVPDRIQPDPRRWTAVGWANAVACGAFALLAVLTWPAGDDELGPFYVPGYLAIVAGRATFVRWRQRTPPRGRRV
jgi:hypothetical protein